MEALTVGDILNTQETKIANGEIVSGKEYLDRAIAAFGLKPCDYSSAFFVLQCVAKGYEGDKVVNEINRFWQSLEKKYSDSTN